MVDRFGGARDGLPEHNISYRLMPLPKEWPHRLAELDKEGSLDLVVVRGVHPDDDFPGYLEAFIAYVPKSPFFLLVGGDPPLPWRRTFDEVPWADSPYVDFVDSDFPCAVGCGDPTKDAGLAIVYFRPFVRRHGAGRRQSV